jgi:DNA ligase-1
MNHKFKPMLAVAAENLNERQYPMMASPKLDGIRAIVINGVVVSRSLKPIPNAHVQKLFGRSELNGLDGELICGSPCGKSVFRDTNSAVMSKGGEPDVQFYVFDDANRDCDPFTTRIASAAARIGENCILVPHKTVNSATELEAFETECLEAGYEGVMLRDPAGEYKFGRSTLMEGLLLKVKRFLDSEAEILGLEELMQNANEASVDLLGHTERSTCKSGLVPKGTLGAIRVRDIYTGAEFNIGSGFDAETRSAVWAQGAGCVGQLVKYKYFPTGNKDLPRFPVFLGFRNSIDM